MDYIIKMFGEPNEIIDEDLLEEILEEIDTLNEIDLYKLALHAIELGKPQLLEHILKNYKFNKYEINNLKKQVEKCVEEYVEEIEDYIEIVKKFEEYIKNAENPRNRNNH